MAPKFSKNGKRLGRPPKNKPPENPGVVFNVITPAVPVKEEETAPVVIDTETMIPCELVAIPEHMLIHDEKKEKRYGVYSSSIYADIENLNFKKWIVVAYLKADFQKYREEGLSNQIILQRCVNFLNMVEPRKKFAKKDPTPKYGKLELFKKEEMQFVKKFGHECAVMILITDQRKCEHFWGEGAIIL